LPRRPTAQPFPDFFAVCKCALPVAADGLDFQNVMSFADDIAAGLSSVKSAPFASLFRACEPPGRPYTESAEHFAEPE
jgi:hypothetical protein